MGISAHANHERFRLVRASVTTEMKRHVAALLAGLATLWIVSACGGASPGDQSPTRSPCIYDSESDSYKECLMTDVFGDCLAFGIQCRPSSSCVYESETQSYKECMFFDALGQCQSYGLPCTPGGTPPCMYDPEEDRYRECYHATVDGKCAHYGNPCVPE